MTLKITKPSPLMDIVVNTWIEIDLLVPNPNLKFAQALFLVPKPEGKIRPIIIDYSPWTQYIIARLHPGFHFCLQGRPYGESL